MRFSRNFTVLVSVLVLGVAAGCSGSKSASRVTASSPTTRQSGLCGSVGKLDRMVVERIDAFPQNGFRFTFPSEVTVTSRASVEEVAQVLCHMPDMPPGPMNCPADWGIDYHLSFFADGIGFPVVSVDVSGCEPVTGLGHVRQSSPGFWHTLGVAMGLPTPSWETFMGSLPGG